MNPVFTSRSQAGQDQWVYDTLVKPFGFFRGVFLDIGASHPIVINNSKALEEIGWTGILLDHDPKFAQECAAQRKSVFVCDDATLVDWTTLLRKHGFDANRIDYVSLDTDPVTNLALMNLIKHDVRFRCATIEHDRYRFGDRQRNEMRSVLLQSGYKLERADVAATGYGEFEDWWIWSETDE